MADADLKQLKMSVSTWREPSIDHDKPIPAGIAERRRKYGHGPHNPSPWVAFLKKLKVGDSFTVPYKRLQAVKTQAKKIGIDVYHRREGYDELDTFRSTVVRVWRIK